MQDCRADRSAFQAMVKLGELNSRMKDFYDIWILSEKYAFNGKTLSIAISKTFANRKTILGKDFQHFTPEFAKSKQKQWEVFHRRTIAMLFIKPHASTGSYNSLGRSNRCVSPKNSSSSIFNSTFFKYSFAVGGFSTEKLIYSR